MSDEHTRPFACGRCDSCEANRPQECLSPRGGCRCAECRPFDVQQTFTRAEVLAFGERVQAHYQEALRVAHIDMQLVDVARLLEEDK